MTRYREGSRLQQCWAKWEAEGSQAMFDFGLTLGLATTTLKHWTRLWERESGTAPSLPVKQMAAKAYISQVKKRIKVSYSPKVAYLVEQGPQASIVMWEDSGREDCIGNQFLGLPTVRRDDPKPIQRRGGLDD
jgi:hypothetical protein